jgi:hypothetical protein
MQLNRVIPAATVALLLVLGFFAFKNGFGLGPTGAVTLGNTSILGNLLIPADDELTLDVENALIRFSSAQTINIETNGREMSAFSGIWINDFEGTVEWNGERIVVTGTMESANGNGLSIAWTKRERATITLTEGVADIATLNLSSFNRDATGRVTLENRWSTALNETPFAMEDFEGRMYLQRLNNETSLGFEGRAEEVGIETENILKILS